MCAGCGGHLQMARRKAQTCNNHPAAPYLSILGVSCVRLGRLQAMLLRKWPNMLAKPDACCPQVLPWPGMQALVRLIEVLQCLQKLPSWQLFSSPALARHAGFSASPFSTTVCSEASIVRSALQHSSDSRFHVCIAALKVRLLKAPDTSLDAPLLFVWPLSRCMQRKLCGHAQL